MAVPDIAAYDASYKRLISKIEIRDVSSSFAMEQIIARPKVPLDYMVLERQRKQPSTFPAKALRTLASKVLGVVIQE